MTDSDSDGAIPREFRRRILQLLYASADTPNATFSVRELAAAVGTDPSVIIREIDCNPDLHYDRDLNTVQVLQHAAQRRQTKQSLPPWEQITTGGVSAAGVVAAAVAGGLVKKAKHRRPLGKSSDIRAAAADSTTGRVGYVCVAEEFLLEELEKYYSEQGYYTKCDYDVLHIRFSDKELNKSQQSSAQQQQLQQQQSGTAGRLSTVNAAAAAAASSSFAAIKASSPPSGTASSGYGATSDSAATTTASSSLRILATRGGAAAMGSNASSSPATPAAVTAATAVAATAAATAAAMQAPARKLGFDLFVFQYGAIVWWGFDQKFFKIVEQDFMFPSSKIQKFVVNRYKTQIINEIYPVWCTYSLEKKETLEPDDDFKDRLLFDHFLIPYSAGDLDSACISMLCASHALAQSAKIDYLEIKIQDLTQSCKPLPRELKEYGRSTISERKLLQLRGEVLSYRLMLKSGSDLLDEPELFWQNAYLKPIFQATKECFEITERVRALDTKLDADNEILGMIADQFTERHGARLEWIVIWLVLVEVIIGVLELMLDVRPWVK